MNLSKTLYALLLEILVKFSRKNLEDCWSYVAYHFIKSSYEKNPFKDVIEKTPQGVIGGTKNSIETLFSRNFTYCVIFFRVFFFSK